MKRNVTRHTRQSAPPAARPNALHRLQRPKRSPPQNDIYREVEAFAAGDRDVYMGFGGVGDLVLLLASCWDNPRTGVIFFANPESRWFAEALLGCFGREAKVYQNIMGQTWANQVYDLVTRRPNFRTSAHLPDGLDMGDWRHVGKYGSRLVKRAAWRRHFGATDNPFATRGVVALAPSGSQKSGHRQRFLTPDEFHLVAGHLLGTNHTVYGIGSDSDLDFYKYHDHKNFAWVTAGRVVYGGREEPSDVAGLLRRLNSANHVVSMDTWLKTYAAIAGIPTTVVQTRWNGNYKGYGEDITDFIFLNPDFWPHLKQVRLPDLLARLTAALAML